MKDLVLLLIHLLTTLAKLLGPGGAKAIVADSLLMKQQLLVISRSRKRAPNLSVLDRFLLGFWVDLERKLTEYQAYYNHASHYPFVLCA